MTYLFFKYVGEGSHAVIDVHKRKIANIKRSEKTGAYTVSIGRADPEQLSMIQLFVDMRTPRMKKPRKRAA